MESIVINLSQLDADVHRAYILGNVHPMDVLSRGRFSRGVYLIGVYLTICAPHKRVTDGRGPHWVRISWACTPIGLHLTGAHLVSMLHGRIS